MDAESDGHRPVSARAIIIAFSVGVLLIAGVCALLSRGQLNFDVKRLQEARALMVAQTLAELARQSEMKDAAIGQAFVRALPAELSAFREGFVLKGSQYWVHSDSAKSGKRLDSKSITDKELFDKSRRLQKAFDENRAVQEETGATTKVANDLEVDGLLDPVIAAVPVAVGDRVSGMAQASLDAAKVEVTRRELWLLGVALVAVAAMAFVSVLTPGFTLYAAILLIAFVVIASQQILQNEQRANYLGMVETRARLAAGLSRALEAAGSSMSPETLAAASVDVQGVPYGDLKQVSTAEPQPGSDAAALAGEYAREGAGSELGVQDKQSRVVIGRDALQQTFGRHTRTLRWLALAIGVLALGIFVFVFTGLWGRVVDTMREHAFAYAYTLPALIGMLLLVFIPFAYGIVLGFMQRRYNVWSFVGLDNFIEIVGDFSFQPRNFYFTLAVTVMWTVINVALHVCIGLGLALLLQDKLLKMKAVYRVLLVIPWAVPNYITALIWQGMFHKEFGAINHYLGYLGIEPISWFGSFWTAFAANVATNTWLGFPFMMVISLGALQSIPTDLYEAADVDGASKFQQFRAITLPLLKPALFPAIILGTIWTFNQFNIIYLVSAGQPANSTDILIVEAYRKAFENDNYGGAAAYSTIIFVILLGYTLVTNRATKATSGAFE